MQSQIRRFRSLGVFVLAGLFLLPGCVATRKFVRNEVGTATGPGSDIDKRNTAIEGKNTEQDEKIDAVDRRAQQGISAAATADTKATQAGTAAAAAQTAATNAQRAADTANQGVTTATNRVATLETKVNSLDNYAVAGEPEAIMFALGSATLSDESKAKLDSIASGVSGQRSGYLLEIQGFTDSTGSEATNTNLSQRRAENVMRYLVSKDVPLFRISIVGLGESKPVADNKTRQGREQNRRVEVRTLRSPLGGSSTN